jgi:hypothetical integral membrane protein (TIGR02206 family)
VNRFFSGNVAGQPFVMFSGIHIATLAVLAVLNIFLIFRLHKAGNEKFVHRFKYCLAGFLVLNELCYTAWSIYAGVWSADYSLPIQLCDAAAFLSAAMLIWDSYPVFEIVYFLGLGGSLQALLTPDLYYPFPHFVYFVFFLGHGAILTSIFYMAAVKKYKPTFKSILKTFVFTNLYMAAVSAVNLVTGGNYMFTCRKPENMSVISFLGPWPWYILSLEAVGMFIFCLLYLPFAAAGKKTKQHPGAPGSRSFGA